MLLQPFWDLLERLVFPLPSKSGGNHPSFNLYNTVDHHYDSPRADQIRKKNLYNYLVSFHIYPEVLAIGEAPGWRGCRFSGVPFTSEAQFEMSMLPFLGTPTSRKKPPYQEASATVFWKLLKPYHPLILTWNCVPLHFHQPANPLSNRKPTPVEIVCYQELLQVIIDLLRPKSIVAIGRIAEQALKCCGKNPFYVRHPSHGGSKNFEAGIKTAIKSFT